MTSRSEFLAVMPQLGCDDPSMLPSELEAKEQIGRMIMGMRPRELRQEFLGEFESDGWRMLLALNPHHPYFDEIVEWAEQHEDVLLLATPAGPKPPAVIILETRS